MGRSPCCDENGLKKGPWTPEEDHKLIHYIQKHGHRSWRALPQLAGLRRCGKSCRLRWTNYLRPDIKRGEFSQDEENTILHLHSILGNKWSAIATHLPGRTDNEIKNFWNTHLKKKLIQMGFDPMTHQPRTDLFSCLPQLIALANLKDLIDHHQFEAIQLAKLQCLNHITEIAAISNLMDSVPPTQENHPKSVPLEVGLENQNYQFSMENAGATISQPLHQIVPFGTFQTTLDGEMRQLGLNVNSSPSSYSWTTLPSLTSSNLSPLTETSLMGHPGDVSSSVCYGGGEGGGGSSDWPEFNFEENFLHED